MKKILNIIVCMLLLVAGNVIAISVTDPTVECHKTGGKSLYIYSKTSANYCECDINKFIVTTDFLSWTGCNDTRNNFLTEEEFIQELQTKGETAVSVNGNMEREYIDIVSAKIAENEIREEITSKETEENYLIVIGLIILLFVIYILFKRKRKSKKK